MVLKVFIYELIGYLSLSSHLSSFEFLRYFNDFSAFGVKGMRYSSYGALSSEKTVEKQLKRQHKKLLNKVNVLQKFRLQLFLEGLINL